MSKDIEAITTLLHTYQNALNTSSLEDALSLYAPDPVCMPPNSPSFVGPAAVRTAYESFFAAIKFDVKFDIQEIVPVAPDWAFARTNSEGVSDVKGRGKGREANQELFVLKKVGGEWKIARYAFSTTKAMGE